MSLVGLDIDNEDKSVVLLNLLHRTLSVERVDDNLVLIETRLVRNRLAWVFWRTGKLEGLWEVEGGRLADLSDLVGVDLLQYQYGINVIVKNVLLTPFNADLAAAEAFLPALP